MTEEAELITRLQKRIAQYEELARGYAKKAEALKLAVEELELDGDLETVSPLPSPVQPSVNGDRPKNLESKTIGEAVRAVLLDARRPLRTNEILKRMEKRGKETSINGLRGVLYGRDNKGRFKRTGKGVWWLTDKPIPEWTQMNLMVEEETGDAEA